YSSYGRGWGYGYGYGGGRSWATDYPKSDRQFVTVLKRLVRLNVSDWENAVPLDDPVLRRFPLLYKVEVGQMEMTDEEVEGLRSYLDAGGFLIVDDFWGIREWQIFEENFRRVYPNKAIVELPLEHPLFSSYYNITEIKQVPAIGRANYPAECRGCEATVRGVFDDDGRLMVVINFNTDLGDAWEWAEDPRYPLEYPTYAYAMDALFQLLFKYRPFVFQQGDFTFAAPGALRVAIVIGGLLGLGAVATYTLARGRSTVADRAVMAGLRIALLAVLVFALLQPVLVVSTVVPQQNFLGVLVDDSRSMRLADASGAPRSEFVRSELAAGEGTLLAALSERFVVRLFR